MIKKIVNFTSWWILLRTALKWNIEDYSIVGKSVYLNGRLFNTYEN